MSVSVGARIGPYEILEPLGAGGMGEVYRARDAKLNRDVAIKVLPELFSADPDRLARFRREAQVLAALNHQNIGHIYGIEDASSSAGSGQAGVHALVLELVDGPTLADRIGQGPIPLDEALPIARQIADALECAHEQGIIHRDLKPANIKVRPDGTVKVLDFGLAKALEPASASSPDAMNSPTLTARGTHFGVIVGTAAYMSPEQARGKAVDRRADIWAFGVVLYEMLSGTRAFAGDDVSITLAAVLKDDVDWKALPADLPSPVLRVLRRCLEKDPKRRLSAIGDARLELEAALQPEGDGAASTPRLSWRHYAAIGGIAALGVLLGTLVRSTPSASPTATPRIEFGIDTPLAIALLELAVSPDGSHVAFIKRADAGSQAKIWVRPLASQTARAVDGTEDAAAMFWAPDSRRLGFVARSKLNVIALSGGSPTVVCPIQLFGGATWSSDDVILFSDWRNLMRVPAGGGTPVQVLAVDSSLNEERLLSPFFLPGGRRFLFLSWTGGSAGRHLYVGSLDGKTRTRVMQADTAAIYSAGHVLFTRQRILFAQRFDPVSETVSGDPVQLAMGLFVAPTPARAAFSVSDNGVLAYRLGRESHAIRTLGVFDRSGKALRTLGEAGTLRQIRLSRNGRSLAVEQRDPSDASILYTMDLTTGISTRLTIDEEPSMDPVWSPDSREIAFTQRRGARLDIYKVRVGETRASPVVVKGETVKFIDDWSPDGRLFVFRPLMARTIFSAAASGEGEVAALPVEGEAIDSVRISPDGRRVAFQSRESDRLEVYVADFPSFARRTRVSANGGVLPRWRADSRELYYLALDRSIMAITIGDMADNTFGIPVRLFGAPVPETAVTGGVDLYDVRPDGKQFFVITEGRQAERENPTIHMIINWLNAPSPVTRFP